MIRHIPEGVFPFDDCGYARTPLIPFVEQAIRLDCLCDSGAPTLEARGARVDAPSAVSLGENRWRFELPPFPSPIFLEYRFTCGAEQTAWFPVDVLKRVRVTEACEVGKGWLRLHESIYWNLTLADTTLSTVLDDHPAETTPAHDGEWTLELGTQGLWRVCKGGRPVVACREIELGLRADGTVAWHALTIEGAQSHVWGTGERFDHVNQQGHGTCGKVVEHFTKQSEWAYLPTPFFLTDGGFGFYRDSACDVEMTFARSIRIVSRALPGRQDIWLLGTPAAQLSAYLRLTGEPALPPEWAFGLWISANGWSCDADVDEQLEALAKYNCPASVMVLEAWSDESTFYHWSNAWRNPKQMIQRVRYAGLHLVLWQIPVLKAIKDCSDAETVARDRAEAASKGWAIHHADGTPYIIPERWFEGSMLPDFTNPEACEWWFSKREHLLRDGVEGFKTDGGEFLFGSDFPLCDGTPGVEAHNLYAMHYVRAYHEWMKKRGVNGVTFSRAGYAGAQTVPIHWAGDQLSTWEEMRGQLTAGLSAGLSGVLFWGFDIGGFAGELPDAELYLRATALGCFSPVMQWHAEPRSGQFYATHDRAYNNDRSPWNLAEKQNAPEIIEIASAFARLRERLRPYLWEEAQHCTSHGRPLMAHLCLDFPDDPRALDCDDQYMLGRHYLVAPILQKGAQSRTVYLPEGNWRHFFTGEQLTGGREHRLDCPLTEALVFERLEA